MSAPPAPLMPVTPRNARTYRIVAGFLALVGILFGAILFYASSIEFDYMKLRGLPIYGNASTLPQFSRDVVKVQTAMTDRRPEIMSVILDRQTMAVDLFGKQIQAETTISVARQNLSNIRTKTSLVIPLTYTAVFAEYVKRCPALATQEAVQADAANNLPSNAAPSPNASIPSASTPPTAPKAVATGSEPLAASNDPLTALCASAPTTCAATGQAGPGNGDWGKMICAERALVQANAKKTLVTTYSYDSGRYLAEALSIDYPNFTFDKADAAIKVTQSYLALRPVGESAGVPGFLASVCLYFLGLPLAVSYLALGIVFGILGRLLRYLYDFADANRSDPMSSPDYAILAGGGCAVLVLLVTMGGFQFLTVGASAPDLAYPNPLTVCGISVISGLGAERILVALSNFIGKLTSS
jgi:hypothetical protein